MVDIQAIVERYFPNGMILEVRQNDRQDANGDAILKIDVVYDPIVGVIDAELALDLDEKLWAALEHQAGSPFPVVSFISVRDAPTQHAAE